ncbi:MAG: hypothetical protein PHU08_00145 [Dehalococcoidales bacterium]|nr:hypothetical protein [Dehalococcoidales bacterium]
MGCPGKEYYEISEIKPCHNQALFCLSFLDDLHEGSYPPPSSGYVDQTMREKRVPKGAYWETPVILAAELSKRLDKTGTDGKLLIREIENCLLRGIDPQKHHYESESWTALCYVVGVDQKKSSYNHWKAAREYRRKQVPA